MAKSSPNDFAAQVLERFGYHGGIQLLRKRDFEAVMQAATPEERGSILRGKVPRHAQTPTAILAEGIYVRARISVMRGKSFPLMCAL